MKNAKTINLLLEDGTLQGIMCIEDSSWNSGELYSAPKESIAKLLSSEACNKFGVYILLSDDMVYVGQSSDLSTRLKQHVKGKEWWNRVVFLTTKDNSLDRADIDYLESALIKLVNKNKIIDCDNKKKGNPQKTNRFREVVLRQYLDEAILLMQLVGVSVFEDTPEKKKRNNNHVIAPDYTINVKSEAKCYLQEKGVIIENIYNYAKLGDNGSLFWVNPKVNVLNYNWDLVLNNQNKKELILMRIPANSLHLGNDNMKGLQIRRDKPQYIDLKIKNGTYTDINSGINFSSYIVRTFNYGD